MLFFEQARQKHSHCSYVLKAILVRSAEASCRKRNSEEGRCSKLIECLNFFDDKNFLTTFFRQQLCSPLLYI